MCCSGSGSSSGTNSSSSAGGGGGQLHQPQWRRCGLCSLVARAFRRAVCGTAVAASRRGSNESYQKIGPAAAGEAVVHVEATEECGTEDGGEARPRAGPEDASAVEGGDSGADGTEAESAAAVSDANAEIVTVDTDNQHAVYIKMIAPFSPRPLPHSPPVLGTTAASPSHSPLPRCLSPEDWALLDAMGACGRHMGDQSTAATTTSTTTDSVAVVTTTTATTGTCSGRFLTMHKRRRKRLTTRALREDGAMLDDVHHGQVQRILERCGLWAFNAFTLETVAGGRSLPVLCVHLFHWYGLLDHFRLDVVRVWKLFTLIEEGYHSTNPYHNSIHATDVTQAMHCFLQEEKIRQHVTPVEIMAALIGAVAHDLDHPGVNQHFLISTSNHLAILYENRSVLENHHWRSALGCLLESGVADQVVAHREDLEVQIRELILATDINRQQEFLTKFRAHLDDDTLDLTLAENRKFILQIALKCADISNPTRPWDISHKWSLKVCDEFFRQGNFERKLNLPVTSICDQQSTTVAKIQSGFFKFVVTPLFSEWHRFCASSLSTHMMLQLESNRQRWETQERCEEEEEEAAAAATLVTSAPGSDTGDLSDEHEVISELVISEDEDATRKDSSTTGGSQGGLRMEFMSPPALPRDSGRRQSLAVPSLAQSLSHRRHSVPVNLDPTSPNTPCTIATTAPSSALPRTIYRRESLPAGSRAAAAAARTSPVPSEGGASSCGGGLREEEERRFGSRGSMGSRGSSGSGVLYSSALDDEPAPYDPDRPLSAENLLPEPSIASMTSACGIFPVGRLSSILQGGSVQTAAVAVAAAAGASVAAATAAAVSSRERALTRQQTFPPPQPYVRVRYMSATAEMSTCKETVHEDDSRSTSPSHSSHTSPIPPHTLPISPSTIPHHHHHIPSIAVLSPSTNTVTSSSQSPPRIVLSEGTPPANQETTTMMSANQTTSTSMTSANQAAGSEASSGGGNGNGSGKREQEGSSGGCYTERASKLVKLHGEKENVDPRRIVMAAPTTSVWKRRSSAPLNLPMQPMAADDKSDRGGAPSAGRAHYSAPTSAESHQGFRRGSVPIEITSYRDDSSTSSTTTTTTTTTSTGTVVAPPSDMQQQQQQPPPGYALLWRPHHQQQQQQQQQQRRGSAPSDLPPPGTFSLERNEILLLTRHTSLNGKHSRKGGGSSGGGGGSGNGKKQALRRRSSGGPETVCLAEVISAGLSEAGAAAGAAGGAGSGLARLLQQRRGTVDVAALSGGGATQGGAAALLARRRGSLPIEVLSVGNSVF